MQIKAITYFDKLLTPHYKPIYKQIYAGFMAHQESIVIQGNVSSDYLFKIVEFVLDDYPQFFFVCKEKNITQSEQMNILHVNYLYSQSEANKIKMIIDNKVNALLHSSIHTKAGIFEKQKALYSFLVQNIQYCCNASTSSYIQTNHSRVGPLIYGKSVCEGYARAFKYLCDSIKLPSVVVSGPAISPHGVEELHAWNIVKLNNISYHVDATWDSCIGDVQNFDYFNLSDEDISVDHSWDRTLMPSCDTTLFPVPIVKDKKDFKQFVLAKMSQGTMSFSVKFNENFDNISEITIPQMVASFLQMKTLFSLQTQAYTIKARYNKFQRKAVISIMQ